jgi:hypothetical protein
MKKKLLIAALLISSFSHACLAKTVDVKNAMLAGKNFYYERIRQYRDIDYGSLIIRDVFAISDKGEVLYYAFNIGDKGYVIASADDAVSPILAYSFESDYPGTNPPPQFTAWMDQFQKQILHAKQVGASPDPAISEEWHHLLSTDRKELVPFRGINVEPFITSHWNQGYPYNEKCPADTGGSGVHAVVGCVPVAMGQIMYYYRWPLTGKGSYTYTDATYGVQSVDFGATAYQWNNMKDATTTSNDGIAELLYHLGVSCDLVYGPDGSGMYNHKAAYSLRTYFKYSPETRYVFRDSTSLDWDSLIIAHLDRRMPLYYAGWSVPNINGHAFVCDGYQDTSYFHFNFGWGGSSDGYFYVDNLTPGGNNFNLAQELIINCYPDTTNYTFPIHCQGAANILNFTDGTIEDGSGPFADYSKPAFCGWLLNPQGSKDSVTSITITFNSFDVDLSDTLIIFDGGASTAPVLGKYTGNTLPQAITSSGNRVYIYFKTTGTATAPGWMLTYASTVPVWCTGTQMITSDTASVSDGSLGFDYMNNVNCKWKLFPENGDSLTIYFRYFDTEPGADVLKIIDFGTQEMLAELSGHYEENNPPSPVTAPSGKMYLIFSTNGSVTRNGWALTYPQSPVGIYEQSIGELRIDPNPAYDHFSIKFRNDISQYITVELLTLNGERVFRNAGRELPGVFHGYYNISSLPPGLYVLKITTEKASVTKKLIIAD